MRKKLTKSKKIIISCILITIFALGIISGESHANVVTSFLGNVLDGIVGILLWPARLFPVLLGDIIGILIGFTNGVLPVTIEDILFNQVKTGSSTTSKLPIININFFTKLSTGGENENFEVAVNALRDNISLWYVGLRNLSIVIIAMISIYVGLRMALATLAADQAKYKKMLVDWLTSLALLFLLHIIMILIIDVNDALVQVIYNAVQNNNTSQGLTTLLAGLKKVALSPFESFTAGGACSICYLGLQVLTFLFFVTYVKRMITVAFLITIAPLVTITYAIDKMSDGKSQAFSKWFKEFYTSVLIQPFNCIAYAVLGTSAINVMLPNGATIFYADSSLPGMIVGIMLIGFILDAENIVRKIFGIEPNHIGRAAENMALLTSLSGAGKKAVKFGTNMAKNSAIGRNVGAKIKNNSKIRNWINKDPVRREKVLNSGKKIAKLNTIAAGMMTGEGMATPSSGFKDDIVNMIGGFEAGHQINTEYIEPMHNQHKLARLINDGYYDENGNAGKNGLYANDVIDRALKLMNDPSIVGNDSRFDKDYDEKLLDAIKGIRNDLALSGTKEEKEQNKEIKKVLTKIGKGELGEFIGDTSRKGVGLVVPERVARKTVNREDVEGQQQPTQQPQIPQTQVDNHEKEISDLKKSLDNANAHVKQLSHELNEMKDDESHGGSDAYYNIKHQLDEAMSKRDAIQDQLDNLKQDNE